MRAKVTTYPLEDARQQLEDARAGQIERSAVLVVSRVAILPFGYR